MMSCQRYAATRRCTRSVVFVTGADPLKFGFGASFNKPGANITGIWMVLNDLAEKRLQLLHDLVPTAESIALLVNPTGPVAAPQTRDAEAGARTLGVRLRVLNAVTENDFDQVFAGLACQEHLRSLPAGRKGRSRLLECSD
jgi:putative ABC transport system substrate-binding protein